MLSHADPLISEELFYRVKAVLTGRTPVAAPRLRTSRSRRSIGHTTELEELDVEGILAFAERLLPSAASTWVHASLDQRQRLQTLFFPEGIALSGTMFSRTTLTGFGFSYVEPNEAGKNEVVSPLGVEPRTNRLRVCCSAN